MSRVEEWRRLFEGGFSPETRLGTLRGAAREGCLAEVLSALGAVSSSDLYEMLHRPRAAFKGHEDAHSEK